MSARQRFSTALALGWVAICCLALATWNVDPGFQHVLQFTCGGLWGAGIVGAFVASRRETGRHTRLWVGILCGVPVAAMITFGIALAWEVFSPLGVVISTPLRVLEAFLAFGLGRLGERPEAVSTTAW